MAKQIWEVALTQNFEPQKLSSADELKDIFQFTSEFETSINSSALKAEGSGPEHEETKFELTPVHGNLQSASPSDFIH